MTFQRIKNSRFLAHTVVQRVNNTTENILTELSKIKNETFVLGGVSGVACVLFFIPEIDKNL